MSDSNIMTEYSSYLQNVLLNTGIEKGANGKTDSTLLSYDEFKEFYMLNLIGKGSFVDNLAFEFQFNTDKS